MKKIIVLFFFLIFINNAFAQGGSNYSIFGIGDINHNSGASYFGLGNTAIAFPVEHGINLENPALWTKNKLTSLSAGYKFNQHINYDPAGNVVAQNNGKLNGIKAIFVVDTSMGLSFSLGFFPKTNINYLVRSPLETTLEGLTVRGQAIYGGSGGLSQGYFGGAVEFIDGISIGANIFGVFGKTRTEVTSSFPGENFTFESITIRENKHEGFGFKTGLYIDAIEGLGIGMFWSSQPTVKVNSDLIYQFLSGLDTSFTDQYEFKIPDTYGIGFSYESGKFIFGADASFQNFSDFKFNPGANAEFTNSMQTSIGVARKGNQSINAPFLDKITYTAGFEYNTLYYKVKGSDINEIAGSLGMQMALTEFSFLDAAITVGQRGTNDNDLIKEIFTRLNFNLSIGENWFNPFKRDFE